VRKRSEGVMREAEARYRALVEQIPTVTYVCAFDSEGTILYISPQIEAIVGYPPSRWTEDPTLWQRLIYPEDRERVLAEVARCYEQQEQFRYEYRITREGELVADGHSLHATVERETYRPTRVPDWLVEAVATGSKEG